MVSCRGQQIAPSSRDGTMRAPGQHAFQSAVGGASFTTRNDGARKKRVVEAAARDDDEAKTQEALQYLATRPQRDEKKRSR